MRNTKLQMTSMEQSHMLKKSTTFVSIGFTQPTLKKCYDVFSVYVDEPHNAVTI